MTSCGKTDAFGSWSYHYDLAGRRTRVTWPDACYATYAYDLTGAMTVVGEAGGPLATCVYDDRGRRTSLTRANGVTATYAFDAASRLSGLTFDLAGSGGDEAKSFTYNPAGQILQQTLGNAAYLWAGAPPAAGLRTINGLSQMTALNCQLNFSDVQKVHRKAIVTPQRLLRAMSRRPASASGA